MKKRGDKGADSQAATATEGAAPIQHASDSDAAAGTSSSGERDLPVLTKPAPEGGGPCFNTRSRTKGIHKKASDEKKKKGGEKKAEEKKKKIAPPQGAKTGRRAVKRKLKKRTTTPPKKPAAANKRPDTPRPSPRRLAFPRKMTGAGEQGGK